MLRRKYRNLFLLIASLLFYGWSEPVFIVIMLFATVSNYAHGLLMDKYRQNPKAKKALLVSSIVISMGLLGFFKYSGFVVNALRAIPFLSGIAMPLIPLPIGISFYMFKNVSYMIDVYRDDAPCERNIIDLSAYVTMFPQLLAGPISKYKDVAGQIKSREESLEQFATGVKLFVIGLAKKVLIANQLGVLWNALKAEPAQNGALGSLVGIIAFALNIYFDFSGYSDMACGLGNMLGFKFVKNFDYPYISQSITEFWRRWHISLGTWFRDYLYIPLGGNRKGQYRTYFNLLVVWLLTGLWHGASWNFVLWGLYFCVILIIEKLFMLKLLERLPKVLRHVYSILLILIGWVVFSFESVPAMLAYVASIFNFSGGLFGGASYTLFMEFLPLLVIAVLASFPWANALYGRLKSRKYTFIAELAVVAALLVLCTAALAGQGYTPFLYLKF